MAGTENPCQKYVSAALVAAVTGVSRNTVYRLIRSGQIPSIRVGRTLRVPAAYLDDLPTGEVPDAVEAAAERLAASAPPLTQEQADLISSALGNAL